MSKFKIVPITPTLDQLRAGQDAWLNDPERKSSSLYTAMVEAAPDHIQHLNDLLAYVEDEIDQRKNSGNDEEYRDLETLFEQVSEFVRSIQ